jgi:hypothetical protein
MRLAPLLLALVVSAQAVAAQSPGQTAHGPQTTSGQKPADPKVHKPAGPSVHGVSALETARPPASTHPVPATPSAPPSAKPAPATAKPVANASPSTPAAARPRPVSAAEAMSRINAALAEMKKTGPAAPARATRAMRANDRPAPPRYRLRWPSLEPRWRLVWADQDRVILTWAR